MNHEDIVNYADDNTPYQSSRVIFQWLSDNQFQADASKCHVLLNTFQHVQVNKCCIN